MKSLAVRGRIKALAVGGRVKALAMEKGLLTKVLLWK